MQRITNKPILEPDDRIGESNLFRSNFTANINTSDTFTPGFQVFDGLVLSNFEPFGLYLTGYIISGLLFETNVPITINTGVVSVYTSASVLVQSFTQSDMVLDAPNRLKVITDGSLVETLTNGSYYVTVSQGLLTGLGVENEAINDNTTWVFTLQDADYDNADYNNDDYFTN